MDRRHGVARALARVTCRVCALLGSDCRRVVFRAWLACLCVAVAQGKQMVGVVVFHAAVAPQTLSLNDPLPLILKIHVLVIFTTNLLAVLRKIKPVS